MAASPKVLPPETPAPAPRRRAPRAVEAGVEDAVAAAKSARRAELIRELQGIALLLFGLFLAGAFTAVGVASLRTGFNATGTVGLIGNVLVTPLVWLFGWPAAVLTPLVPVVH